MLNIVRRITPSFLFSWYHFMWAFLGAVFYGFPARGMTVIAVTGTNGKSTTVDMISRIFKEAGFASASMSSVRFQVQDREWRNKMKMTMPGRFTIQQFLSQAKKEKCTHVVLEVTSEGMLQHRHRFIPFKTAVFTNLSPEHIERHGSFENYKNTKGGLFSLVKDTHIINTDDEHAPFFLQFPAKKIYTYGILPKLSLGAPKLSLGDMHIQAEEVRENRGFEFLVKDVQFRLSLLGEFNVYNALAAMQVARSEGIRFSICSQALAKMTSVPGRMEEVISFPIRVVVDYAFTPAALEKVYKTFKSQITNHKPQTNSKFQNPKLICVLGATGGGRDRWKRPVLGKIAAGYCDKVIITDEDPYEEDPEKIMDEVMAGTKGKAVKVQDRREAIKKALEEAQKGDTVVITGKGSEDSIARAGDKIPWDDREVVREEWTKLKSYGKV
ncbi:MAG: UDP-N-acetylmuramoyl-L-alanyl-D-glutamate--2,6-diaminopimelate ligase [bacterium]|nr:UDP-N-acetylmuramoyl-L-alanyl-D-glutamate--2,6-diaminopimelate ligase [bacterium]